MRITARVLLCFALLFGCVRANDSRSTNDLTLAELQMRLTEFVQNPRFGRAQWGIEVIEPVSGRRIFAHGPDKLLKPASTAKLFTSALALEQLGPTRAIRTSLYATQAPSSDGTLQSDLVLFGRGDPSISTRYPGNTAHPLRSLAKSVKAAGVRRIAGDVIGDDTFFAGPPYGSSWTWQDLSTRDGAPVSALTYEENTAILRVLPGKNAEAPPFVQMRPDVPYIHVINLAKTGRPETVRSVNAFQPPGENRVTVFGSIPAGGHVWTTEVPAANAPLWFATAFREALGEEGITVSGKPQSRSWPVEENVEGLVEIAYRQSPPISGLIKRVLKDSENLDSQLLFLHVAAGSARKGENTEESGRRAMLAFVERIGIPPSDVLLDEGSGLSRSALVTPRSLVRLLMHARTNVWANEFRAALPISGVDGTLRARLNGEAVRGRILAKTGTLNYVSTLAGFVRTSAGEELVFAIMLNAYSNPQRTGRSEVDAVAALLPRLNERIRTNPGAR